MLPVDKPCRQAKWIVQVMSGYFIRSMNRYFCRNSILSEKSPSKLGYCLAVLAVSLFGLNGGAIDNKAEAKAKYFSGKTSHSRTYQRSGRKHISSHHNTTRATRHYPNSRVKHRGFNQQRHKNNYRQARDNRYGIFANQPLRYHGPSIIDVHKVLNSKRARQSKAGFRQHSYRGYHRGRHNRINRVVINGAGVLPRTDLYRHIERDDATGVSVIYFDKKKCDQGYDCVMRMGLNKSSAKIIVVGTKRQERFGEDQTAPRIIYPPY